MPNKKLKCYCGWKGKKDHARKAKVRKDMSNVILHKLVYLCPICGSMVMQEIEVEHKL